MSMPKLTKAQARVVRLMGEENFHIFSTLDPNDKILFQSPFGAQENIREDDFIVLDNQGVIANMIRMGGWFTWGLTPLGQQMYETMREETHENP
jgi:hypothetical protein